MRAPHQVLVDWVMADYDGLFPNTTRAIETIKCVLICYVLPILALVIAGLVMWG